MITERGNAAAEFSDFAPEHFDFCGRIAADNFGRLKCFGCILIEITKILPKLRGTFESSGPYIGHVLDPCSLASRGNRFLVNKFQPARR
ncbi:hypothetical protein [Rhizobium sp.]|uniref:hypothetical protein n=1 Tax=Rhizobium sp. TaxID=391 RepID=UPI0028B0AFC6